MGLIKVALSKAVQLSLTCLHQAPSVGLTARKCGGQEIAVASGENVVSQGKSGSCDPLDLSNCDKGR